MNLEIKYDFRRNLVNFPILQDQSAEDINPEADKCNNFNYRFVMDNETRSYGGVEPKYIVQHYTVANYSKTIELFTKTGVSAHYVIPKDGVVQEFVSPAYRAYHAGVGSLSYNSKMNPKISIDKNYMNSWSIGIENVNSGNEAYTKEQVDANLLLCDHLCETYSSIDPKLMLGHSDWSVSKKIDPGPYFPWKDFAQAKEKFEDLGIQRNFGVFQRENELELKAEPSLLEGEDLIKFQELLKDYGYDIPEGDKKKAEDAIIAYKLHFCGDQIINNPDLKSAWDDIYGNSLDSCNEDSRTLLAQVTENDLDILNNIIDQF